jgi:hypothetical protein
MSINVRMCYLKWFDINCVVVLRIDNPVQTVINSIRQMARSASVHLRIPVVLRSVNAYARYEDIPNELHTRVHVYASPPFN